MAEAAHRAVNGVPAGEAPIDRLEAWCIAASRSIAFVGVLGMLIVASVTVLDVLLRWLFGTGVTALNEISTLIFAVAVSACMPAGLIGGVHLTVDVLKPLFSPRLAGWLAAAGQLFLLAFFGMLAWRLFMHADALVIEKRMTVILGVPEAPFMYAAAILFWFGAAVQCVVVAKAIRSGASESRRSGWIRVGRRTSKASVLVILVALAVLGVIALAVYDFGAVSAWAQRDQSSLLALATALMWAMLLLLVPLAAVLGLVGLAGIATMIGVQPALTAIATEAARFLTDYQIATLPLFLMMGSFAAVSDLATDLYDLAHVVLGRFRGGLALATIGGCAGFGALTSSSIATAALIGKVAIPEMRRRGYSPALATGCCAAGGTLGPLVPPGSGPLVVFALLTEASVGQLFVASVGPAILAVGLYFATIWLYVRLAPRSAPLREPASARKSIGEIVRVLWRCKAVMFVFFLVMGGLYTGVFTDTESAAVGAFTCFAIAVWRGKLGGGRLWAVMAETTATTAMIYGLIFGAQGFAFFLAVSEVPQAVTAWFAGLGWHPMWIMALLLVGYLILGSMMESFAVMVITVPVVTPLVLAMGPELLGVNADLTLIWWGVIMMCVVETGMIHPPLGLNVFVLKNITPDVGIWTIYKGVFPFVISDLIKLVLMVAFPSITLWLVGTMMRP
jgi:tripartite ATP-independent transporter DctM subunit